MMAIARGTLAAGTSRVAVEEAIDQNPPSATPKRTRPASRIENVGA